MIILSTLVGTNVTYYALEVESAAILAKIVMWIAGNNIKRDTDVSYMERFPEFDPAKWERPVRFFDRLLVFWLNVISTYRIDSTFTVFAAGSKVTPVIVLRSVYGGEVSSDAFGIRTAELIALSILELAGGGAHD